MAWNDLLANTCAVLAFYRYQIQFTFLLLSVVCRSHTRGAGGSQQAAGTAAQRQPTYRYLWTAPDRYMSYGGNRWDLIAGKVDYP